MDQIQREAERETLLESVALSQASNTPRSNHSDRGDDRRRGGPRGGGGGNIQDSDGWTVRNKLRNYTFEASELPHRKGTDSEPASQNPGTHYRFKQWSYGSGAGSKLQSTSDTSTTYKFALLQEDKKMPTMMSRRITPSSSLEKERAVQSVRDGGGGGGGNIQESDGWIISNKFRNYMFKTSKRQQLKGTDSESASQNPGTHGQYKQWSFGSGAGSKLQSTSDRHGLECSTTYKFALLQEDKKMPTMMSRKINSSSSLEKERAVQSVRDEELDIHHQAEEVKPDPHIFSKMDYF